MAEQLQTATSNHANTYKPRAGVESAPDPTRINWNWKGKLAGVLLGTGVGVSAVAVGANILHEETIATDLETVGKGSNATETALKSLNDLAENEGIDPNNVRGVFDAANQMGNVVHEGDEYKFELNKNGLDQLSISVEKVDSDRAEPDNLAHLND
ncbi:hypothetical protein D3C73_16070 [compost metagenome]